MFQREYFTSSVMGFIIFLQCLYYCFISLLFFLQPRFSSLCLADWTWSLILLLFTFSCSLHASQNKFLFDTIKCSLVYCLTCTSGFTLTESFGVFPELECLPLGGGFTAIFCFLARSDSLGALRTLTSDTAVINSWEGQSSSLLVSLNSTISQSNSWFSLNSSLLYVTPITYFRIRCWQYII